MAENTVKKIATRESYGNSLKELAEEFPNLVVLDADLAAATKTGIFRKAYPDRHIDCGIAESNMMGVAAGLSLVGKIPFVSSFAMFAAGRAFEQVRNSIGYPHLNVKIGATHAGITVGEDGATHQAIEDIAIMRALPNMRVIVAADPGEVKAAVFEAIRTPGPVYVRLGRSVGGYVHPNPDAVELKLGQAETLRDGTDVTLVGVGVMVEQSLIAAEKLQEKGISARVINLRTVKPIDVDTLAKAAKETGAIVTAEDHNCFGGLFGAVSEALALTVPVPVERVALEDTFGESGNGALLLEKYGLTADRIVEKEVNVLARK